MRKATRARVNQRMRNRYDLPRRRRRKRTNRRRRRKKKRKARKRRDPGIPMTVTLTATRRNPRKRRRKGVASNQSDALFFSSVTLASRSFVSHFIFTFGFCTVITVIKRLHLILWMLKMLSRRKSLLKNRLKTTEVQFLDDSASEAAPNTIAAMPSCNLESPASGTYKDAAVKQDKKQRGCKNLSSSIKVWTFLLAAPLGLFDSFR
mmetsp:Transcript_24483/g.80232  ORF Transcript_24483/g.80232 Transcript_24483/m.80232 type:complete len:206 (-) Transcript_24483:982-1599(-)